MSKTWFRARIAACGSALLVGGVADAHQHAVMTEERAASGCHTSDVGTTTLVRNFTYIVTGTDSITGAARTKFNLPQVPANSVIAVSTTSVCQRAALAYGRNLSPADTTTSRLVYVIRIGTTRYVVGDPNVTAGEFMMQMVFDTAFTTKLAGIAG